jgi:hypothetical protein
MTSVIETVVADQVEILNAKLDKLSNMVIEMKSNQQPTIITNNQHNNFNVNLFLNENATQAKNFIDMIQNISVKGPYPEEISSANYVSSVVKMITNEIDKMPIDERPIHCTDVKRETMYIKDEDKWTKEVDDSKLQKAIQTVSYKSMGKLTEWKQENPDYQDMDSEFSKRCLDMQRQSLAGSDREVYYPKVIHALAKETMVDK